MQTPFLLILVGLSAITKLYSDNPSCHYHIEYLSLSNFQRDI